VSDAHQFVAWAVVVMTIGLAAAAGWSVVDARRASGARDHRFAVDRLVLLVLVALVVNLMTGGALLAAGHRPGDPLHLLYGPAALLTLPIGWWLATRRGRDSGRRRQDVWTLAASVVLLGLEARLFMTG
jgi:hypothetical protein